MERQFQLGDRVIVASQAKYLGTYFDEPAQGTHAIIESRYGEHLEIETDDGDLYYIDPECLELEEVDPDIIDEVVASIVKAVK